MQILKHTIQVREASLRDGRKRFPPCVSERFATANHLASLTRPAVHPRLFELLRPFNRNMMTPHECIDRSHPSRSHPTSPTARRVWRPRSRPTPTCSTKSRSAPTCFRRLARLASPCSARLRQVMSAMVCFLKEIVEETESNVMPKEEDYVRVYMTVCGLGAAARRAHTAAAIRRANGGPTPRARPVGARHPARRRRRRVLVRRAGRSNGDPRPVRSRGRGLRLAGGRAVGRAGGRAQTGRCGATSSRRTMQQPCLQSNAITTTAQ
jgi:hypothetical protein